MKLGLKDMVDVFGYEFSYGRGWIEEAEKETDQLLEELGVEELGFFKSISKVFKRVFKGVKKVFRKPLKIIKKPIKVVKSIGTKAWKLVRRNKRTLTAVGLLWAGKHIPWLRPVATEYATYQASNLASKYLTPSSTATQHQAVIEEVVVPAPAISMHPPTVVNTRPPTAVNQAHQTKNELVRVFLPIGALLASIYLFGGK